jgi:hypothetical protein
MNVTNYRTCLRCGWVHNGVTRQYAEAEVARFNEYFDNLTVHQQVTWYGGKKSCIENYENCFRCGNSFREFRLSVAGDAPMGVTIQSIIDGDSE